MDKLLLDELEEDVDPEPEELEVLEVGVVELVALDDELLEDVTVD